MATEAQTKSTDNKSSSKSKSGLLQTVEKDAKPAQSFLNKFNNDWVMNFSGIVAYNLLMSMLPIAIALLGILGLFLKPSVVNNITGQIAKVIPSSSSQSSSGTQQALELALNQLHKDAGIIVAIAILLALFGGSRLFVTLEGILDLLYRVRPRPVLRQNLVALIMLLLFIVLIPIMVFAAAAPSFVLSVLGNSPLKNIPVIDTIISPSGQIGVTIAGIVSGLIVSFVLFEAIYFIVPNQRISWRNSWRGAVVASILLNVFLVAFPFYVAHFLGGYAGQIGFAVILLIFFYYFAVILLLGAEVNAYIFEKVQPLPNDLVTFVSTMGGKLNRDIPSSEAPSHTNTAPTDKADKTHVRNDLQQEVDVQKKNQQVQQQIASAANTKNNQKGNQTKKAEKEKKQQQGSSTLTTTLSVVAGTALAFVFQVLRMRQRGK
jgi:YihY family inner membrane protein